jgi:hypothetical protein
MGIGLSLRTTGSWFVSHCLLNENTRYLGGAFHRGAVPEMIELLRSGVGVPTQSHRPRHRE